MSVLEIASVRVRRHALELLEQIRQTFEEESQIKKERDDAVAIIDRDTQRRLGPVQSRRNRLFNTLANYATRNRRHLLEGERKSFTDGGAQVGWRTTPSRVIMRNERATAHRLIKMGHSDLVRITYEVNETALRNRPELVGQLPGVHIVSGEQFFAKPAGVKNKLYRLARWAHPSLQKAA